MIALGITDHLEGPRECPSEEIYAQIIAQTELADALGFEYAWFTEHHAHAHQGHLPAPLLMALHLAGRTRQIRLGTAVICLNLHHPLDVAEQVATADLLMQGRSAFGFGSGSTPEEFSLFGREIPDDATRHVRFEQALRLIVSAWKGEITAEVGKASSTPAHRPLPLAREDLPGRAWLAVNSAEAARIAGSFNFNMLFAHLRTPGEQQAFLAAYRSAGGKGLVAANRPVHVAQDDAAAWARAEPAVRTLWRRFRYEGKIPADTPEPSGMKALCGHPLNFIIGGPETVARELAELHAQTPFDVANLEVRWDGLNPEDIQDCIRRLVDVRGLLDRLLSKKRVTG